MSGDAPDARDLQTVAALHCEGMSRADIARILSLDEDEVQRLLEAAEQLDYLRYEPRLHLDALAPEVQELVASETLTTALTESLRGRMEAMLTPILITPSPPEMFESFCLEPEQAQDEGAGYLAAEGRSLRLACARAGRELSRFLFDGRNHTIGLNWGYIVGETIEHLRPLPSQLRGARIQVVSLFGDLDFHSPDQDDYEVPAADVNCNTLVARLAQRLGGRGEAVPLNVPGFVPARFVRDEATFSAIRGFMTSHSTYREIFGGAPPDDPRAPRDVSGVAGRSLTAHITDMDTIVTGLGAADAYTVRRNYHTTLLDPEEIDLLLRHHREGRIVGDIGGHLVGSAAAEREPEVAAFLARVNRRILAAQPSDFIDVASRSRTGRPGAGVVAITVGARKAAIVHALLSWTPCPLSRLVLDTHAALALLRLLDADAFRRFLAGPGRRMTEQAGRWSPSTRAMIPCER